MCCGCCLHRPERIRNLGRAVGVAVVAVAYQAFAGTPETAGVPPQAFLDGFRGVFLVGVFLAAVAFVSVTFMHRRPDVTPH
jgi:hypothetical protein